MKLESPLRLASRSPRRRMMLESAGFHVRVQQPDFDDGALRPGRVSPREWVTSLAILKAWRVADMVRGVGGRFANWVEPWNSEGFTGTVLGADTMCVQGCEALGQPRDEQHARRMLRTLSDAEHETITGVCLISLCDGRRIAFCDSATVRVGHLSDEMIEQYVASGQWRGKAGAYNLSERIQAGWPIQCIGDPATVMGLPMNKLRQFTIAD